MEKITEGSTRRNTEETLMVDWCEEAGGHWVTANGKHICISNDKEVSRGMFERKLLREGKDPVRMLYSKDRKDLADKASGVYNALPTDKVGRIKEIRVLDDDITIEDYYSGEIPGYLRKYKVRHVKGLYNRKTQTITIYKRGGESTLFHEMGHGIAPREKGTIWIDKRWNDVWSSEKVSRYAAETPAEGWAEAFELYNIDKKKLKSGYPRTYKYVKEYVSG